MYRYFLLLPCFLLGEQWYQELLHPNWRQSFAVSEILHQEKSDVWDLLIFKNDTFGKVLAMDGTVQLTEKDEFIYHEMMAHVPLLSHPHPTSLLIIGGGDGGLLRESLKHASLKKITVVEIDPRTIALSQTYFPALSNGGFSDSRVEIVIQDAYQFVQDTDQTYDVILCDTTDPIGAAEPLFSKEFYGFCKKLLNPKGILVTQNGVPFLERKQWRQGVSDRKELFKYVHTYLASIPTYVGGPMAFVIASDERCCTSIQALKKRVAPFKNSLLYYTPHVHKAAFHLPSYLKKRS